MLDILSLIAPVFGLIGLGLIAAKTRMLEPAAARTLAHFGYRVAMPALLFRAMVNVGDMAASPLWLAAAYATGIAIIWSFATLAARALLRRPADEAPSYAMAACFSNGVMLGFPIILLALGPDAATPMAVLATCETVVLWLLGTLHMSLVARDRDRGGLAAVGAVLADVARNPLILALAAGLAWRGSGLTLPGEAARFIDLLAGAAIPVSLFALGMSLAAYAMRGALASVAVIGLLKLAIYPALAFWLAVHIFALPPLWAGALVIYVSMPVGANAFIFAARYEKAVAPVSGAVAVTTALSVVSVTLMLALLKAEGILVP